MGQDWFANEGEDDDLPKDRFINPHRVANGDGAQTVVKEVLAAIAAFEADHGLRKRSRRPADSFTFERVVEALVCDMAVAIVQADERGTTVSLSKRASGPPTRYQDRALSVPMLTTTIRAMEGTGYLLFERGHRKRKDQKRGQRSLIWPGPALKKAVAAHGVGLDQIGWSPTKELIWLRDSPARYGLKGRLIDYDETPLVRRLRSEMQTINAYLASADIAITRPDLLTAVYNVNDRRLRRSFTNGSFESGGRLFDGFWQEMRKVERITCIRIEGEPVVSLDYKQIGPRTAYAVAGGHPTVEDLYSIRGLDSKYRDGIKKLMNAMLFASRPLKRMPRDTKHLLPPYSRINGLTTLIGASHPFIEHLFYTGVGHRLQFIESNIIVAVLMCLRESRVVALPVHDALVVKRSAAALAAKVMQDVAEKLAGTEIPVEVETYCTE